MRKPFQNQQHVDYTISANKDIITWIQSGLRVIRSMVQGYPAHRHRQAIRDGQRVLQRGPAPPGQRVTEIRIVNIRQTLLTFSEKNETTIGVRIKVMVKVYFS